MKRLGMMKLLFSPEGDGTGGGAGGGSLLNTDGGNGGGQAQGAKGAANAAGAGDKPGGNPDPAGASGAAAWISALPKELQEDASLKKFSDVQGLAKSYINAQKLLGADKIPVPSQHATDEDWQNVFNKLGLPESVDKYEVKFGDQATLDKKFVDEFKALAHKSGILPKQAQKLADWFTQSNLSAEQEIVKARNEQVTKEVNELKTEWGKAFDDKIRYANNALAKFADAPTLEYLGKTGLSNDVRLVKLLSAMGEQLFKEGKIPDAQSSGSRLSPADARKAATTIIGNMDHPYHQKGHPGHKAAVEEVAELFNMASAKSS